MRGDHPVSGRQGRAGNSGEVLAGKDTSLQSYSVRIDFCPRLSAYASLEKQALCQFLYPIDVLPFLHVLIRQGLECTSMNFFSRAGTPHPYADSRLAGTFCARMLCV